MIRIKIPATTANLGVLFDKGGAALDVFSNVIEIEESDWFSIRVSGGGSEDIPTDKNNLVYRAIEFYYQQTGMQKPGLSISTYNEIPLSRGLGSSAACIAGGIFAANELAGVILSEKDIIIMAAEMEGHGDNVCAAVAGGFTVFNKNGYEKIPYGDVGFILYIPETTLSTKKSRGILPDSYDAATFLKAKELEKAMLRALHDNDFEKAGALMEQDVIHQPYRSRLLPYWDEVIDSARESGAWGTALSGAGPTMISMCSKEKTDIIIENVKSLIDKRYKLNIIGCEVNPDGIVRG